MKPVLIVGSLWLLGVFSMISSPVLAAECSAASGQHRVALLELYTSEGCSSCPPADRWLSGLKTSGMVPEHVVPLALHVDYWDYIGWKDRFAKPVFTSRQHEMASVGRATFVYTPQVMLNGRDYRGWGSAGRFENYVAAINSTPARANIQLTLKPSAKALEVTAMAQAPGHEPTALYVALYENALTTEVKAGENGGATLHHDYVVRKWLGPYPLNDSVSSRIPFEPEWQEENLGVAAFVQDRRNGDILQALALPMCEG